MPTASGFRRGCPFTDAGGKGGEEGELTGRASLYMVFFSLPVGIDKLSFSTFSVKQNQCDDIDYAAAGEQQET